MTIPNIPRSVASFKSKKDGVWRLMVSPNPTLKANHRLFFERFQSCHDRLLGAFNLRKNSSVDLTLGDFPDFSAQHSEIDHLVTTPFISFRM